MMELDGPLLILDLAFNIFLSYTATMLNILTIMALKKTKVLPKTLKTLLMSLAVSDLGVGLVVQPLKVATSQTSAFKDLTKAFEITAFLLCNASFFGVIALTVDRFLAIHLHLRYQEFVTRRRVVITVALIWTLSTFSSLWELWNSHIHNIISAIIPPICLISTGLFYCKIYAAVRRHRKEIHVLHLQQKAQDRKVVPNAERIRKSAVGTFYVYILFLVCYLPYICINYIYIISGTNSLLKATENYSLTLLFLNSSLNPLVYCWKMKEIRHAIMELLRSVMLLRKQADPR